MKKPIKLLKNISIALSGGLLILTIYLLFLNPIGGTYPVFHTWGWILFILFFFKLSLSMIINLSWDNKITKKERNWFIIGTAFLLFFYIFPSLVTFNVDPERYVIDDVKADTNPCEIDYYAAQYPNATFMVIPLGIPDELVEKLKNQTVGVHGYSHYIPEGIIPFVQLMGYKQLSEKLNVTAYRPPNYINNLLDYLLLKDLKFYPIGHKNMVIHVENSHC